MADVIPITTPNDPNGWYVGEGGLLAHRPSTQEGRWRPMVSNGDRYPGIYQAECHLGVRVVPADDELPRCPDCEQGL